MGKMKENPRYNVISTRVDDETHKWLCGLSKTNETTISIAVEAILKNVRAMSCRVD